MSKVHFTPHYFHAPQHPITIALIGCGGTGSRMIQTLARMHMALKMMGHPGLHVKAFDPDKVTRFNVGRQLFYESDLGFNKATVLISRCNASYGTVWESVPFKYDYPILQNLTISCIDSVQGRRDLRNLIATCNHEVHEPHQKQFYWLDIGNSKVTGQIILGTIDKELYGITSRHWQPSSKMETTAVLQNVFQKFPKLETMEEDVTTPSCSLAEALEHQDLYINSTLAELAGTIIWSLFRKPYITIHGAYVNLGTLTSQPIRIS